MKNRFTEALINGVLQEFGESSCYALALLGRIFQQTERLELAEVCYIKSLNLNPFLWTSFEKMCEAGKKCGRTSVVNADIFVFWD